MVDVTMEQKLCDLINHYTTINQQHKIGIEEQLIVHPVILDENVNSRLVVHFESTKDIQSTLEEIHSNPIPEEEIIMAEQNDWLKVIEKIQENENMYRMALVDKTLPESKISNMEYTMRKWEKPILLKVLQLCTYMEANKRDMILISSILQSIKEIDLDITKEQVNIDGMLKSKTSVSENGLCTLASVICYDQRLKQMEDMKDVIDSNYMKFTMRKYKHNTQCHVALSPGQIKKEEMKEVFLSATEQVAEIYSKVFQNGMSIYQCYREYTDKIKNDRSLLIPNKILKVLLMKKVLGCIGSIIDLYEIAKEQIPLFSYSLWNVDNIQKLVATRQKNRDLEVFREILEASKSRAVSSI
jgi:hypothetical protein